MVISRLSRGLVVYISTLYISTKKFDEVIILYNLKLHWVRKLPQKMPDFHYGIKDFGQKCKGFWPKNQFKLFYYIWLSVEITLYYIYTTNPRLIVCLFILLRPLVDHAASLLVHRCEKQEVRPQGSQSRWRVLRLLEQGCDPLCRRDLPQTGGDVRRDRGTVMPNPTNRVPNLIPKIPATFFRVL